MKKVILLLCFMMSFTASNAQHQQPEEFFMKIMSPDAGDSYKSTLLNSFIVIDSIEPSTYGNSFLHLKIFEKGNLIIEQSQVNDLEDSLNLKLNTTDISTWAKQALKPPYTTSEIIGYTAPINYTAGTGIDISSGVISTTSKRQETYSGTTNASGQYTVVFSSSYSVAPNIQANIIGAPDNQNIRITSIGTTGFTVTVRNRVDVVGLLPTWTNVNGAVVDVLITQK